MKYPSSQYFLRLAFAFCTLLPCSVLYGQFVDYDRLLDHLQLEINLGNPKALRDLGSLLDNEEAKERAKEMLLQHSLFTATEIDLSQRVSRQDFLDFFYENKLKFKHSQLLNSFYLTPVEQQKIEYEIKTPKRESFKDVSSQLRKSILRFEAFLATGDDEQTLKVIQQIGKIDANEGYRFLVETLERNKIYVGNLENPKAVTEEICLILTNFRDKKSVEAILQLVENKVITEKFADPILAKLTNIKVFEDKKTDGLAGHYRFWLDSLGSVAKMREFGYQRVFNIRPSFFQFPVDYYGKVLSQANKYPWIRFNARKDLVATQHPRSLFYLAGLMYRYRTKKSRKDEFLLAESLIKTLTHLEVYIEGENGKSFQHNWLEDEKALLNYLKYWAVNYNDFEWDDIRKSFVNREAAVALTENYERLFRRLNSPNDSVAMQSYFLLTEGDPVEVVALAKKYKELLRNYNRSLPSLKKRYLENLVQLTHFCRQNSVRYKAPPRLQTFLNKLGRTTSKKERYSIENQIISRLQLDEVTALEYWGCLNETSLEIAYSTGRILDQFYTNSWDKIIKNESNIRLYLKKAKLFSDIGAVGVCNDYLKKFEVLSKVERTTLEAMLEVEIDQDVIQQINTLLNANFGEEKPNLERLLTGKNNFSPKELTAIPAPNGTDLDALFDFFAENESNKATKQVWSYLNHHQPLAFTPIAMQLLHQNIDERGTLKWLEKTYGHQFQKGKNEWLALFERDYKGFNQWARQFFDKKIALIKSAETLTIRDINGVTQSDFYHASLKNTCLTALQKVKPTKNVRRLKMQDLLSIKEDLTFFQEFELKAKELDDIPKLFDLKSDLPVMVEWLLQKSADYSIEDKGSFFNSLFRSNWFNDYVNNGQLEKSTSDLVRKTLQQYAEESDYLSEFEELETVKNTALLDLANKSLEEKVKLSLTLDIDLASRKKIQHAILARINYDEIPIVAPYFNDLAALESKNFLADDFGLPIYDLTNYEVKKVILEKHQSLTELEFYTYFLQEYGVDFLKSNGNLDFDKIFNILQYEIITPFVGEGGNRRDYFTYGIIKILELHFDTTLGFHEKLNENQTFYTFNSAKRATAWRKYLLDNQIIKSKVNATPSFNVSLK